MSIFKSRVAAVAAGALIIAGVGATSAVAANKITSKDIKNHTIRSVDVKNNSLGGIDIRNGSIRGGDLAPGVKNRVVNKDGTSGVEVAELEESKVIENIGGGINENNTDLEVGLTLQPGKYLVTVDGAFMSDVDAADTTVEVYPQLSLWVDRNEEEGFQWQAGEGDISPNAVMPVAKNRHISVSGTTVVEVDESTEIGLLGFGYTSTQGSERSGEINVVEATLTATPLN